MRRAGRGILRDSVQNQPPLVDKNSGEGVQIGHVQGAAWSPRAWCKSRPRGIYDLSSEVAAQAPGDLRPISEVATQVAPLRPIQLDPSTWAR